MSKITVIIIATLLTAGYVFVAGLRVTASNLSYYFHHRTKPIFLLN